MLKAVAAVIVGFLTIGAIAVSLDFLFSHLFNSQYGPMGEVRSTWMLFVILGYTMLACAWGGYTAAIIAPERAAGASLVLAILMVVLTIVNLSLGPSQFPLWWRVLSVALEGPAVILGARLRKRIIRSTAGSVA